ncbi:unnamed protein product [Microthlaspi erraticum]|uniref:F-box domain-containing protein n=1 Tax=Microthlaspi erraticum TaxID=1685480 RepID=A0A6D2JJ01_9BRAS|nr:unnamed protein product [Microthlaspi erraticum]
MRRSIKRNKRNISDLPDDLLLKIWSLLPAKDAVATSVLSKRWHFLWKQQDVDYVELCFECSILWVDLILHYSPTPTRGTPPAFPCTRIITDLADLYRDPPPPPPRPPPPPKLPLVSLMCRLKAKACIECRKRTNADKRFTIFIFHGGRELPTDVFTWTKEKHEMEIAFTICGRTTIKYCLSLNDRFVI